MEVVEAGVSATTVYTLMLLHGTDFRDRHARKSLGLKGAFGLFH